MPEDLDTWMTASRNENDADAFARVVEGTHHLLRATVLRETANPELADELAQEAFVRAWTRRGQYRPGTSPRSWLLAIVRSQLVESRRRYGRNRRHMKELIRQELLRKAGDEEEAEMRRERMDALRGCLDELEPTERRLLDLVHGQGLSTSDAAEALGIRPPTCRQRLSRLQRALRECAHKRMGLTA